MDLLAGLREALDVLEGEGLRPFLWGGTLLGIVREDRLLPWDGDVDLGLLAEECAPKIMPTSRLIIRRTPVVPWMREHGVYQGNAGMRLAGVKIGLHIMSEPRDGWRMYTFHRQLVKVPDPAPLGTLRFDGRDILAPADPAATLDWQYGDWHERVIAYNRSPQERARQRAYLVNP